MILKPRLFRKPRKGHWATKGLAGLWLFNEGSGNTVQDASGSGNTGTLVGDTHFVPGPFGSVLSFDGTGDYISLTPFSASLGKPRSWSAWVYNTNDLSGDTGNWTIFSLGRSDDKDTDFRIRFKKQFASIFIEFGVRKAFTWKVVNSSIGVWTSNILYHVFISYDGSNVVFYLNGKNVGSAAVTSSDFPTSLSNPLFHIGANVAGAEAWEGTIDLPTIWNRDFSASEVAELYWRLFGMFERDSIELWVGATSVGVPPEVANPKGPLGHPLCGALAGPISF